jgi:hypothetical protein
MMMNPSTVPEMATEVIAEKMKLAKKICAPLRWSWGNSSRSYQINQMMPKLLRFFDHEETDRGAKQKNRLPRMK